MSRHLEWLPSDWGDGFTSKGLGGYYIVMVFAATGFSPGRYVASHRSCFSQEPHYFGNFQFNDAGLEEAKNACQAREDFTCRRLGVAA